MWGSSPRATSTRRPPSWPRAASPRPSGDYDSPELHLKDTLEAGVGLCDEDAVRVLVEEGPARVRELEALGTKFDRRDGKLVLASEGAHSVPRVVRAGGDATGSVVASALAQAMTSDHQGGAPRERVRHRPAGGRRALRRRPLPRPRRGTHRDAGPGRGARLRRRRPGVRAHHQPAGGHRRRAGHGLPGRRGHAGHGVHAVPPHRLLRRGEPHSAAHRGPARRGRVPARRRGGAVHGGLASPGGVGASRRGGAAHEARVRPGRHRPRVAGRPAS